MADVDDGHPDLVAETFEIRQDLVLARIVERRKRIIHEQQLGRGQQRPAYGHSLLLAAREKARTAAEQMSDTEQFDHLVQIAEALGSGREPPTIEQVLAHGEMREEASFLKDVTDAAAMLRYEDALLGVDEDVAVKRDVSPVRTDEAADDVDERCLARPGSSEQRRDAPVADELGFELDRPEPMLHVDRDHASTPIRRPTTRPIASEPRRANMEPATAIAVSRNAAGSPPGICVNV